MKYIKNILIVILTLVIVSGFLDYKKVRKENKELIRILQRGDFKEEINLGAKINNNSVQDIARVQILISKDTQRGRFNDSLYYSIDEFNQKTQTDIDNDKNERVNKWIKNLEDAEKE